MGFKDKTFINNNPPQLEDDDLNGYKTEFNNVISSSGQTPANGTLDQTAKGVAMYAARGDFYSDSGAANAYVLSPVGLQLSPITYEVGMRVRFLPANNNASGASTVDVNSLGVKNIKLSDGSTDPLGTQIESGIPIALEYDGTNFRIISTAKDIFENKTLAADATVNGVMSDLTFTLTAGVLYEITGKVSLIEADASGIGLRVDIKDGATIIDKYGIDVVPVGDSGASDLSFIIKHEMVNTSLEFHAEAMGAGDLVEGNGTKARTNVTVRRIQETQIEGTVT